MKWGVRRTPEQLGHRISKRINQHQKKEAAFRKKLTNISKNGSDIGSFDEQRFKYRNQPLYKRAAQTANLVATQMLVEDVLNGNFSKYGKMNNAEIKKEIQKRAVRIAASTALNVATQDAIANHAAKKYTNQGKKKYDDKLRLGRFSIEKETLMEMVAVDSCVNTAMLFESIRSDKQRKAQVERSKNEEKFNRRYKNILSKKVDDIL